MMVTNPESRYKYTSQVSAMESASTINVNLDSITSNLQVVRSLVGPDCRVCGVVKADAYGLGAARVGVTLARAGADMLAVYRDREAVELADVGIPVLVLAPMRVIERAGPIHRMLLTGRLHCALHGIEHLEVLESAAHSCLASVPVHVEVDTGMGRGGRELEQSLDVVARVAASRTLRLAGIFTHYSSADRDGGRTDSQSARFGEFLHRVAALQESAESSQPQQVLHHAANTHAMLRSSATHFSMVRVGLAWTGFGNDGFQRTAPSLFEGATAIDGAVIPVPDDRFEGVVSWRAGMIDARRIPKGSRVGYGGKWMAARDSVVATVPVGYADGYPCAAGSTDVPRRIVRVRHQDHSGGRWHEVPVLGAVNMDQISLDLTDLPWCGGNPAIVLGAEVELLGSDPNAGNYLPRVAREFHMHAYELLCRLHPRVKRTYGQRDAGRGSSQGDGCAIAVGA